MAGKHRKLDWVDLVFPGRSSVLQPVAEQRVLTVAVNEVVAFRRDGRPIGRALPRIGRQHDLAVCVGVNGIAIQPRAVRERRAEGMAQLAALVVVALERRQGDAVRACRLQRLRHIGAQDGVRADFQEQPHAAIDQLARGRFKLDRLADIAPPIAGVQFGARQRRAGHR